MSEFEGFEEPDEGEEPTVEAIEQAAALVDDPTFARPQGPKRRPGPNDATLAGIPDLPQLPVEEPDEETPPDDSVPLFLLQRNKYGPGAHGVYLADGTPVGVWVREQNFTPEQVEQQLTALGLPEDIIDFYVRNRRKGIAADAQIAAHPATEAFAQAEQEFEERKEAYRDAFVKAQKKKQK